MRLFTALGSLSLYCIALHMGQWWKQKKRHYWVQPSWIMTSSGHRWILKRVVGLIAYAFQAAAYSLPLPIWLLLRDQRALEGRWWLKFESWCIYKEPHFQLQCPASEIDILWWVRSRGRTKRGVVFATAQLTSPQVITWLGNPRRGLLHPRFGWGRKLPMKRSYGECYHSALLQNLLPAQNSNARTPEINVVLSSELKSNWHVILQISRTGKIA